MSTTNLPAGGPAIRNSAPPIPVAVLGGNGYVAGELLRLLASHPALRPVAAISTSQAGQPVVSAFPHLRGTRIEHLTFEGPEALPARFERGGALGVLSAMPHGATASVLDGLLAKAEEAGAALRVVDLSADFRFAPARYEQVYGHPHGAPGRSPTFICGLPELTPGVPPAHVAHPGCFTTAVTLAAAPFVELTEGPIVAMGVTGSSGSGRKLSEGTHHPSRRSDLYAYGALPHRHEAEMRQLLAVGGVEPELNFLPHSGPFVRGIHATLSLTLREATPVERLVELARARYAASPFVRVEAKPPHLTEVVGTNRCSIGVAVRGRALFLTSVIDNLVKGAAGGGVQWLNRLFGLPESAGLELPGVGWF